LILQVLDASEELSPDELRELENFASRKRILVLNKTDLQQKIGALPSDGPVVKISCLTGEGIEQLKDAIKAAVWSGEIKAEMLQVMINSRHQEALQRAKTHIRNALEALRGDLGLELVSMDLRMGTNAVGEVVGKTTTEDLLDSIFSQFCIGK
jgi:tRNA modification GTPase